MRAGGATFGPLLPGWGVRQNAARLSYAGRWLTPPIGPLRFDNRFFLLEHLAGDEPMHVIPGELVEGEWIAPAAALARWQAGTTMIAPRTRAGITAIDHNGADIIKPDIRAEIRTKVGQLSGARI